LISEKFKRRKDNSIFIDRDPQVFKYILEYIRYNEISPIEDQIMLKKLLIDADFFLLEDLKKIVQTKLAQTKLALKNEKQYVRCQSNSCDGAGGFWNWEFKSGDKDLFVFQGNSVQAKKNWNLHDHNQSTRC